MRFNKSKPNSGFVALIIAIVFSLILMVVAVTLNRSGFFARSAILEAEYKETSVALAEACVDAALLRIALNPNYLGNETINIKKNTCLIRPIISNTIETEAVYKDSVTRLRVVFNPPPSLSVVTWTEVISF